MHPNAVQVVEAGRVLGVDVRPREFSDTRTAVDAARAIGVDLGQIVKSLVFVVALEPDGEEPVVALVSGDNMVDEAKLAGAAGGVRARRADAGAVRDATGFPVGGVPPFGHRRVLRVFVDRDLLRFEHLWAAAGTPWCNFEICAEDLVRVSGGRLCELARD